MFKYVSVLQTNIFTQQTETVAYIFNKLSEMHESQLTT